MPVSAILHEAQKLKQVSSGLNRQPRIIPLSPRHCWLSAAQSAALPRFSKSWSPRSLMATAWS